MKKYLYFSFAAAAMLSSCSNDEVVSVNEKAGNPDAISYSVRTENSTRADEVWGANNIPGDFSVFAKCGGKLIIDGDKITYDDATHECSGPLRFWPQDISKGMTFYGLKDSGDKDAKYDFSGNEPSYIFEVKETVSEQSDLLYARKTMTAKETVAMNFRHALSQVVFAAKNADGNLNVTVNSVSVCNTPDAGTYTLGNEDTDVNIPTAESMYNNTGRGSWNYTANSLGSYTVEMANPTEVNSTDPVALTTGNKADAMLLLPRAYMNGANVLAYDGVNNVWSYDEKSKVVPKGSELLYFVVNAVVTMNGEGDAKATEIYNGDIIIPVKAEDVMWLEGKKYLYTFVFSTDGTGGYDPTPNPILVKINYSVTVDEFVEQGDKEIEF